MNAPVVPQTYEDWRYCITILCGLELSAEFIEDRIGALNDPREFETQKFTASWGSAHRERVIEWFQRAGGELRS